MQKNHSVSRSNANESLVSAQDFPKSGFDFGYKSYQDYCLGRLHVSGYQHTMPGDKFNGVNGGNFLFNRIVTPVMSDVVVSQQNFFLPYRAVDRTYEDAFAPNKNNSMSADWHAPGFTLRELVERFVDTFDFDGYINSIFGDSDVSEESYNGIRDMFINKNIGTAAINCFANHYLLDWLDDYYARAISILVPYTSSPSDGYYRLLLLDAIFTPFFGENSLLDLLGYNYLRRKDLLILASNSNISDLSDFVNSLDDTFLNEYAIRIYYAIWYEHYRDINLEPVSPTLPKWKDFGSSSVIMDENWPMLVCRIRSWAPDMFVSAQPDDICRHVFAPIFNNSSDVEILEDNKNYLLAESRSGEHGYSERNIISTSLTYRDVSTGTNKSIVCPIPASVNDSLAALSNTLEVESLGMDLLTLRRAQMLEKYLKRNFYFGDEYKDRMLAHYGSRVSDMRINRPELLSSSLDSVQVSQEVSSVGTSEMAAGEFSASATAKSGNDGYSFFAEEFGMVINIISFMPKAQYSGVCPQNLLYKQIDFPLPEFANQNEELGRVMEVASSGLRKFDSPIPLTTGTFGHYPYAHGYRSRVDEVHGSYLSDRQNFTFRRFFGMDSDTSVPKLNYQFIHCRPNLGMFVNQILLDGQCYGFVNHEFYVERVLPTPVEQI